MSSPQAKVEKKKSWKDYGPKADRKRRLKRLRRVQHIRHWTGYDGLVYATIERD